MECVAFPDKNSTEAEKDSIAELLINSTATTIPTPREIPIRHKRDKSLWRL
jgi:hypothetical protein